MTDKKFLSIFNQLFVLDTDDHSLSANIFMETVLTAVENKFEYAAFCKWLLEETSVTRTNRLHRENVRYVGIRLKVTRESLSITEHHTERSGMLFITSASAAAPAHEGFIKAIQTFQKAHKAKLVVLPSAAHVKALESQPTIYSPSVMALADNFATEFYVNDNLVAMDLRLLPQQQHPLTGLSSLCKDRKSVIIASPKQHLETIASSNEKLPRLLLSTGSCTLPVYQNNRIGKLAERDHVIGGVIVSYKDSRFILIQVQADEDGSFIYTDHAGSHKYLPNGEVLSVITSAIVLGDIHSDLLNTEAWDATREMIARTKPETVFVHDLFDADSITHHHKGKALACSSKRFNSLKDELIATKHTLDNIVQEARKVNSEVFVVSSNHNDFLQRYLTSMDWGFDTVNIGQAAELFVQESNLPGSALEYVVDPASNCTWLSRTEDLIVSDYNLAHHGDLGVAGSKGSLKQLERYNKCIIGHSHSPKIIDGSVQVGCLCELKQGYAKGLRTWHHANCLVFENGTFNLMFIIDGEWYV